jgi:putative membrane protein
MPSMLPPLTWHTYLHGWHANPVWDLVILAALAMYVAGLVAARRNGVRAVHPARVVSFVAGLGVLALCLNSAIDVYSSALFWDHMIEHLTLIMVVPALLVMGHPLTVMLEATTGRRRDRLQRMLHSSVVSVISHPVVGLGFYSAVIVGTHLTSFMDRMMEHAWLGPVEQVLYLASGSLLLLPLLANEPIRRNLPYLFRILLLLFAMLPDTVVGIVLMQSNHDMFPVMEAANPAWAPDALDDMQIGGAIMWAGGDGLMMCFAVGLVVAVIANPARGGDLGTWLDRVRRETLSDGFGTADAGAVRIEDQADVDDDAAVLAAYNRMLGSLNDRHED